MTEKLLQSEKINILGSKKNSVLHMLIGRTGIILLLLGIQFFLLYGIFVWFRQYIPHFFGGTIIFTLIILFYLINSELNATGKLTWMLVIMLLPFFGAAFYWFTQAEFGRKLMKRRLLQLTDLSSNLLTQDFKVAEEIEKENIETFALQKYIENAGVFPIYKNTDVVFFPSGEDKFACLLQELEKAEHFIFMEYFIIAKGYMWGEVLEILARKAKSGVDVRVMYDGTCELVLLPHAYPKDLKKLGIKAKVFFPLAPVISTYYNYRDHRKIAVIDGHTAFNGGINIGDEYINRKAPYGHWKDTAVMLKGDAVKSFTLMFLQMWNITESEEKFTEFLSRDTKPVYAANGYVMPYADMPLDNIKVGEMVYIDILNRAKRYVHIMTPYLILDEELESALKFAALRGVEVKIILPGIPDKKAVYALAKTHFCSLLSAGIEIYTYIPGFIHAKEFISDGNKAVIGTINLDYRSLYHHFECATYMYKTSCIEEMEKDFNAILGKSHKVGMEDVKNMALHEKLLGILLKALAPLL